MARKTESDPCFVCGLCYWAECPNSADFSHDVVLKRAGRTVFDGEVELCAGHTRFAQQSGHVNVRWEALEQALALQKGRA